MKQIRGFKVVKTISKSEYTQIILLEKYGINYILKMATHEEYNPFILKEFYLLKHLFPHGFVPKPISLGKIGRRMYFIREWIEGEPLKEYLKDKNDEVKFHYMKEIFCIIFRLQTRGIAVIDISPYNFIVDKKGRLFLLDLGFAYLGDKGHLFGGTIPYTAPEIINQDLLGDYPPYKADVYSVAAMFYEIFSGTPPYEAPNPDALLLSQHKGPPPLINIKHQVARKILEKALCYDFLKRPAIFDVLKMFDFLQLRYCFVPHTISLIFTSLYEMILKDLYEEEKPVINIFSPSFPSGLADYVKNDLRMRLETKSFKVSINNAEEESDVVIYVDHLPKRSELNKLQKKGSKTIIFSNIPVKAFVPVSYINFTFDEFKDEKAEVVLTPELLGDYILEDELPLFVKINLKILETLGKKFSIEYPVTLESVSGYIYAEFTYIIDFFKNFIFALPRDYMFLSLLSEKRSIEYVKNLMEQYEALIDILKALGLIVITPTHIILTLLFDRYLRKDGSMNRIDVAEKERGTTIYDAMEDLLIRSSQSSDGLIEKVTELIEKENIPRSHVGIFLNKLIENTNNDEYRIKLFKIATSMGFWKSGNITWAKLMEKYVNTGTFDIQFARLAIEFGKYREAVMALKSINTPKAHSMLLYTYALYGKYDEIEQIRTAHLPLEKNAYYYLGMGFYHLYLTKSTRKSRNFAIKAGEISLDPHTKNMSQYLYAMALREEGNKERALRVLESMTPIWDSSIEALLLYFQLAYLYYQKNLIQKAQYYFEYTFLLATEIKHLSFSVQAALYLGYIYLRNLRLESAYRYLHYTYKYLRLLHGPLKPFFYRIYFKALTQSSRHDKAREFITKYPEVIQYLPEHRVVELFYNLKDLTGLKKVLERAKLDNKIKTNINSLITSLINENKQREV